MFYGYVLATSEYIIRSAYFGSVVGAVFNERKPQQKRKLFWFLIYEYEPLVQEK